MKPLVPLLIGLAIFLGGHAISRFRGLRASLVGYFGEKVFYGLFSLVALMGIAMIAYGFGVYRAAGYIPVWEPPKFLNHLTILLVWPAMILIVASNIHAPSRIKARTRHPMLLSVKIWATAHLLVNGDLGSIILFGSFLGWAVFARIALKRAGDNGNPEAAFAPNAARNDMIAIVGGTLLTLAFVFGLHRWLIGVAIM